MGRHKEHRRKPYPHGEERESNRLKIVEMKNTGLYSDAAVAEELGMSRSGVADAWNRYQRTHSVKDAKIPGRPRKLSPADERQLKMGIKLNRWNNAVEAQRAYCPQVCVRTVRYALKRLGARAYVKHPKPALTTLHMKKRLAFAKEHLTWTSNMWKLVIFTDEAVFQRNYNVYRQYVWDLVRSPFSGRRVQPQVDNKKKDRVLLWAALYAGGILAWQAYTLPFKSANYIELLKAKLPAAIKGYDMDLGASESILFQQDNASIHTSAATTAYLDKATEELAIDRMEWPPKSPDLSPIENFWAVLKHRLGKHGPYKTTEDLQTAINDTIYCMNYEADRLQDRNKECMFSKMYKGLPARMRSVVHNKGGSTVH